MTLLVTIGSMAIPVYNAYNVFLCLISLSKEEKVRQNGGSGLVHCIM